MAAMPSIYPQVNSRDPFDLLLTGDLPLSEDAPPLSPDWTLGPAA